MKALFSLIASVAFLAAQAQQVDSTIKLDLLNAPANPAFNILGIAPEAIERPTDLTAFMASVQQSTGNFTAFPNSYALQVAPFLLGHKPYTALSSFDKNTYSFQQSFLVSLGYTHMGPPGFENVDSLRSTKIGLGLKFSIVRPEWTTATRYAYLSLVEKQKALLDAYRIAESASATDKKTLDSLRGRMIELAGKADRTPAEDAEMMSLSPRINTLLQRVNTMANLAVAKSSDYDAVKKAAQSFKSERRGFFLDFNSGFAFDFANDRFNNGQLYRGGAWFTGGYEHGNQGLSFLFITRFLYNPGDVFDVISKPLTDASFSTFDAGGKLLLPAMQGKFVVNAEAIYRSVLGSGQQPSSWRVVANAEYDLGPNRKLTFSFGRDFDKVITKGGNVIAALNFIAGFGGERKIF